MSELKFINLSLVLLFLFSGITVVDAQSGQQPDIRGQITKLDRIDRQTNNLLGSILVIRDKEDNGGDYDRADVKITSQTQIYRQADRDKRMPVKIDALRLDQRVEIYFAPGPALMSYPIQVGAAEIIIMPDPPSESDNSTANNQPVQNSDSEITQLRRSIDTGNAVWVAAGAKGDPTMLPDTFTPDGLELASGGKVYQGRKRILELMRELMKRRGGRAKLTVTTTDVWRDGNTAFETGTAVYEFMLEDKPQILERRYFTVWKRRKIGGEWNIYADTGIAKQ